MSTGDGNLWDALFHRRLYYEKEGEKDYEDKKTYCCGFNGTYATGTYARNQYTGKIKM